MKQISLSLNTGPRGIAWYIRYITEGGFSGEIFFIMPEKRGGYRKFVEGTFQKGDYSRILKLLEKLDNGKDNYQDNAGYMSKLIEMDCDKGRHRWIANYSSGDENKTEIGKTYKELLVIIESYLKPYYKDVIPEGESCDSVLI